MSVDRINELREKVVHGVPGLTLDEQRELIRLGGGKPIEKRKRCGACGATGKLRYLMDDGFRTSHYEMHDCSACGGSGYLVTGAY